MGGICGFSPEFVIKVKSTTETDWKAMVRIKELFYVRDQFISKFICESLSLVQVSEFSDARQVENTPSHSAKKSGSLLQVFTSWQKRPQRDRTISEDSVAEENFNAVKMEGPTGTHTCSLHVPTQGDELEISSGNLTYEAESPDEAALVHAAKAYGFILLRRSPDSVAVRLPSGELVFKVLDTLTFDSTRKRMSVLVEHPITKEYVLYTKGADYAIMELLGAPYAGKCSSNRVIRYLSHNR